MKKIEKMKQSPIKALKNCFSQQMKLHNFYFEFDFFPFRKKSILLLLYRKENSELDSYCRHNVCLSCLFISRKFENLTKFDPH